MGKFDGIEKKLHKVVKSASLQNKKEQDKKNIIIYNVPVEWSEAIKEHGFSFSAYAKMALIEKMKKDGLL
ncbi:hypothetical protein NitYY0826_P13 (plasmid) [Nitratiruptor sp. YY08-26]|uniref:hypothetical protein n=1 Tax=unclassified Nitratiruptor TaxID=2624044 RepID=UPI0018ED765B|nr:MULTISPECIES: hypothetical protein [unclassified Nitratiruptor]BCD63172.1 hypothetical protein NitYY0813_P13 [Nitratiruptor sp. YY08-13]BCD67108.1 hypothetical protein NitYY0826_P13 [Nitratiruptor sp. YY08-26]